MHSIPIPLLMIFIPRFRSFPHSTTLSTSTINSNSHKGFLFLPRNLHPILDIIAWFPYGLVHFTCPFVVAIFLWLFRTKPTLHLRAKIFEYISVLVQLVLPCSAPCYELIYRLTPANYDMTGPPRGLARIDALFHSSTYTAGFTYSPLVFGAFPSLHAGNATLEALFLSHFPYIWAYAGILYWATMYLTHHYLIDVVGRASPPHSSTYTFPTNSRGLQPSRHRLVSILRVQDEREISTICTTWKTHV